MTNCLVWRSGRLLAQLGCFATLLVSAGCGNDTTPDDQMTACHADGEVVVEEATNYSFSSALTFPVVRVAPDTELTFDWSGLTQDFLGHPLDPLAEVDTVYLMLWQLSVSELQAKLHKEELRQSDLVIPAGLATENATTSASLFELRSPAGEPLSPDEVLPFVDPDRYPREDYTYTLVLASGDMLGQGTRMIQAFELGEATDPTSVSVTDVSTKLSYTVDLVSQNDTLVPPMQAAIEVDWSEMRTNAMGEEFVSGRIDEVVVARFADSVEELEARFLELLRYDRSIVAEEVFRADVPAGASQDLSKLVSDAGDDFQGIDQEGTWLLALFCGTCRNPSAWYLTFLRPCTP